MSGWRRTIEAKKGEDFYGLYDYNKAIDKEVQKFYFC